MANTSRNKPMPSLGTLFLSGFGGACISKSVTAPFERIKLLLQCERVLIKQGKLLEPYKGFSDCKTRTIQNEGIFSLWRGNLLNIIRYFPVQAFNFAFKDMIKMNFKPNKTDSHLVAFSKNTLSGGVAGVLSLSMFYPFDYVITRLANDLVVNGGTQFSGFFDVCSKTIAKNGINGLYSGFFISSVGIFIYRLSYFGLYDICRPIIIKKNSSTFKMFVFANLVTIATATITYPLDTIRRHMILTSQGTMECFHSILNDGEGYVALFDGLGANILRSLVGSVALVLVDMFIKSFLNEEVSEKNNNSDKM